MTMEKLILRVGNFNPPLLGIFKPPLTSLGNLNEVIQIDELNYQLSSRVPFRCTVLEHPETDNLASPTEIAIYFIFTGITTCIIVGFYYKGYKKNMFSLPSIKKFLTIPTLIGYTRLRRDRVLRNPVRNNIMNFLEQKKDGASFKEIQQEMSISHPSYLNYHLRRMMEFHFVKNVDNYYFHQRAALKKSFANEIQDAMEMGARTPTEIATQINSYPQKVRYHMKKHGFFTVCETDYSKRKR